MSMSQYSCVWNTPCVECGQIASSGSAGLTSAKAENDYYRKIAKEAETLLCKNCKAVGTNRGYSFNGLFFPSQVVGLPVNSRLKVFAWSDDGIVIPGNSLPNDDFNNYAVFNCIRVSSIARDGASTCIYENNGTMLGFWPRDIKWIPAYMITHIFKKLDDRLSVIIGDALGNIKSSC